ncbi:hypothetical protein OPW33_24650 [Vibrio europaeus]|uniref:hypothetical protein n=1 Tax=Vibrio europaeus TaxID=300876 RepID=UPI002340D90D|nr:hypothetical protein [Vibrio europaeus]MDC5842520.1 hypothetical protein [Vibrio europaeus]
MQSTISVPTDNPYKLMAIVGALLLMLSFVFLGVQTYKFNSIVFDAAARRLEIHANTDLSDEVKEAYIKLENRKIDIAASDGNMLPFACAIVSLLGLGLSFLGFRQWLTDVYPREVQIRKEQLKNIQLMNQKLSKRKIGPST